DPYLAEVEVTIDDLGSMVVLAVSPMAASNVVAACVKSVSHRD
ncbi:MAG: hypothetical protein QOG44_3635, partial [Acidimicrobiaceae bacterium]|nr:hypothetical protein [Acidimicrobiaceae bacterium]